LAEGKKKPSEKQIAEATERFLENEALTTYTVNHYFPDQPGYRYDDLIGAARLGLWKACLSFDPSLGTRFSTFAIRCIANEVKLFLRQEARQVPMVSINEFIPDLEEDVTYECLLGNGENVHAKIAAEEIVRELKKFPLLNAYVMGKKSQGGLAVQLGCSRPSVHRRIRHERRQLKQQLKKLGLLD